MIINRVFNYLNKISRSFYFLTPHLYSVGDASETLMFGLIKAKNDNKKLFVLQPYDSKILFGKKICNDALFLLESQYIYKQNLITLASAKMFVMIMILPSRIIDRIFNIFCKQLAERSVVPMVGYDELWATCNEIKNGFYWDTVDQYEWHKRVNYSYELDLNERVLGIAKRKMAGLGINASSWFVCFHVRESGFRKDEGRREYRNSNILNYLPAIREIIKACGIAVRMGDSTMTPLPVMKNLIDYPFTEYKSASMDIYLIKNCKFYIGTDSGIIDTAKMFSKHTLITNMVGWLTAYPSRSNDRGIYKHVYHVSGNRYLTFSEILNNDWNMQALFGEISDDYELVENTEEDIKEAVVEFLECHHNNDFSLTKQQIKVNDKRVRVAIEIFKKYRLNKYVDNNEETSVRYRMASRINRFLDGSICNSYLDKYIDRPFNDSCESNTLG